jgi:hypothetical protein
MNNDNSNEKRKVKNIIYIDCFAGCAGDMLLGAFFDMGLPFDEWKKELSKLNLSDIDISLEEKMESSIKGKKISIVDKSIKKVHRHLSDIDKIINSSSLSDQVKKESLSIFKTIAEAEAKIHNTTIEKIHFHEVGAIDSITDIVGFCIAKDMLKIDEIISSPFHLGTGTIIVEHGVIPVPAPATLEIIRGKPAISKGVESELTTPTGAAILSTLATEFGNIPNIVIQAIGYGYGTKKLPIPNFLRILYGNRGSL